MSTLRITNSITLSFLALVLWSPSPGYATYKCALVAAAIEDVKPIDGFNTLVATDRLNLGFRSEADDHSRLTILNRKTEEEVGFIWVNDRGGTEVMMPLSISAKRERYGIEAKFALLKFVFEELGITTVRDEIHKSNIESIRLHKKLGYTRVSEGDGESFPYALTKEQFLELVKLLSTQEARRQYFKIPD